MFAFQPVAILHVPNHTALAACPTIQLLPEQNNEATNIRQSHFKAVKCKLTSLAWSEKALKAPVSSPEAPATPADPASPAPAAIHHRN